MSGLFEPATIGSLKLRNRFVRSATAECMATPEGVITPRLIALYSRLAKGGIGLLITGGAYVHPTGRSYVGVTGIHEDGVIPGLRRLTEAVHEHDSRVVLQLYHCGRQGEISSVGGTLLAPSPVPDRLVRVRPRALPAAGIEAMVAAFGEAAARARVAGFDGVQILAANGYLINQFLSPHTNRRQDEWGGNLLNRARFLLEAFRSVRRAVGPDFPILVKLTANDFVRGGLKPEESLIVAQLLAAERVDCIEVTGGTLESCFYMSRGDIPMEQFMKSRPASTMGLLTRHLAMAAANALVRSRVRFEEAYFAPYARAIRRATRVPVILVGGLRSPVVMDQVLRDGTADFVAMARPFLREPSLVRRIQAGDLRPSLCVSCNRCLVSVADGQGVHCFGG